VVQAQNSGCHPGGDLSNHMYKKIYEVGRAAWRDRSQIRCRKRIYRWWPTKNNLMSELTGTEDEAKVPKDITFVTSHAW